MIHLHPPVNMGKESFGKKEKIRRRNDYQAVYQGGARLHSKSFIVVVSPNQEGITRLGVTVSKKVGNSVKRNRIKRLVREFFRLNKDRMPHSTDIVCIARKTISSLDYKDVCSELEVMFEKL
ncbi:MAG: ribonuclease P protein component [Syntrophales bacterium]|jgi:ribonuclease P protein component|nr:ribonuclease P protein component [Syntrophales bacterium]MDY0044778.1 ribonuclease P protein component [Syntrophales bacterium]